MNNIAIIPARGGSKRIPRKNIRTFVDKPMIAHSIELALKSDLFKRVIVSTDDDEIAAIALQHGAEVPFARPAELSDDHTGTIEVIQHAIHWIRAHDIEPTAVCCIYATAPLIQPEDLQKGWKILQQGTWQYVFSAARFAYPIFRGFVRNAEQGLDMIFPENYLMRSQDLPEVMHDAGQFYWGKTQAWIDGLQVFEKWSTVVELPSWRVQDIDINEDWKRAEIIYGVLKAGAFPS
jgi:pseudaminic acid cytidylyltransferase